MIKQQRIDVTNTKTEDIHPDFLSKVVDTEIKFEDKESEWIKTLSMNIATGKHFRLCYNGEIAFIVEGTEELETATMLQVEEFATEQLALSRVNALGLKLKKELNELEQIQWLDKMYGQEMG